MSLSFFLFLSLSLTLSLVRSFPFSHSLFSRSLSLSFSLRSPFSLLVSFSLFFFTDSCLRSAGSHPASVTLNMFLLFWRITSPTEGGLLLSRTGCVGPLRQNHVCGCDGTIEKTSCAPGCQHRRRKTLRGEPRKGRNNWRQRPKRGRTEKSPKPLGLVMCYVRSFLQIQSLNIPSNNKHRTAR